MARNIRPLRSKAEILQQVNEKIHSDEFSIYMDSCLEKWEDVRKEMDIVDCIMEEICVCYAITKDDLMYSRETTIARGLMFYFIKKNLTHHSYEMLSSIFKRDKSYIHKAYEETTFAVEKHKKESIMGPYLQIQKALKMKNEKIVVA